MSEKDYHTKEKVNDPEWRRENKVTISGFIDVVLDTMAPRDSPERADLDTLSRSERRKWENVIEWADGLGWFTESARERSPRSGPQTPPGPPGDPSATYMDSTYVPMPYQPYHPVVPQVTAPPPPPQPTSTPAPSSPPKKKAATSKKGTATKAKPTPSAQPAQPTQPVGRYGAVPPPEELYQEIWHDAHAREEKCLPPFSYLSHFLTMLLLGGGCQAFYSFLSASGVNQAALDVFTTAVTETAVMIRPGVSLTSAVMSAACSVVSSASEFVFNIGQSLQRMSGPVLNMFYLLYPMAVIRRNKGVKESIDSVIDDAQTVFTRLTTLRHGVSDARDRRIIEARVRLNTLKRNKVMLKNKLMENLRNLKGGIKTRYNSTQEKICQALMEIYGGRRRGPRIDSVEKVNRMFERALNMDVSSLTSRVLPRRPAAQQTALTRDAIYGPALIANQTAMATSPMDEGEETGDDFIRQFADYDASGRKRQTRKRKNKKGKRATKAKGKVSRKGKGKAKHTRRHNKHRRRGRYSRRA